MTVFPVAIPSELDDVVVGVPPSVFGPAFRAACQRLDAYIGIWAWELANGIGLPPSSAVPPTDGLMTSHGWDPAGSLTLSCLLETLELYGHADRTSEGWQLHNTPDSPPAAELRRASEAILPAASPAFGVLELCAAALPAVLRGEVRGEDVLFSPASASLWFDYFSNANPHYAPNNSLAALALARFAPPAPRILEIGGGGGSAGEAAIAALTEAGKTPSRYVFTELAPAFLRRGTRLVRSLLPPPGEFAAQRLDIDVDPCAQGLLPESFDAIVGVNTVHLAADVVRTLAALKKLLRPGGILVLGELVRPHPSAPVHLELPFTLLEAYRRAPLDQYIRQRPGFISRSGWIRAFLDAGFVSASILPANLEHCVELYPGFYCAALIAYA